MHEKYSMPSKRISILLAMVMLMAVNIGSRCDAKILIDKEPKGWVSELRSRLATVERLSVEFNAAMKDLKELGAAPPVDQLEKLALYRQTRYKLVRKLGPLRTDLKDELIELWKLSAHGGPILAHSCSELAEQSENVLQGYRAWLEKHQDQELEEVVKEELPQDVEAVRTEYCWAALQVLRRWIYFTANGTVLSVDHGSVYDLRINSESRESAHAIMKKWYEDNHQDLKWSSDMSAFARGDATRFEYPEMKLELEFP